MNEHQEIEKIRQKTQALSGKIENTYFGEFSNQINTASAAVGFAITNAHERGSVIGSVIWNISMAFKWSGYLEECINKARNHDALHDTLYKELMDNLAEVKMLLRAQLLTLLGNSAQQNPR